MSESVIIENTKQNSQKPPLSVGRIVGEIFTGLARFGGRFIEAQQDVAR